MMGHISVIYFSPNGGVLQLPTPTMSIKLVYMTAKDWIIARTFVPVQAVQFFQGYQVYIGASYETLMLFHMMNTHKFIQIGSSIYNAQ